MSPVTPSTIPLAIGLAAALTGAMVWMVVSLERLGRLGRPELPALHAAPVGGPTHTEPPDAGVREPLAAIFKPGHEPGSSRESSPRALGRVDLQVVDDESGTPIRAFSWSVTSGVPGTEVEGESVAAWARLTVPLEVSAAVTVSAAGYDTSLPVDVSLADGNLYRSVGVRLLPVLTGPAIALSVRDQDGQVVPSLRISCAVSDAEGGANAYRTSWTRTSTAGDGLHEISGLKPGRYRLRLVALNEEGHPLAHSFEERIVWFDGVRAEPSVVMSIRQKP